MSVIINALLEDFFNGNLKNYTPSKLLKLKFEFLCNPDDKYIDIVINSMTPDEQISVFTKMYNHRTHKPNLLNIFIEQIDYIDFDVITRFCTENKAWTWYLKILEETRYYDIKNSCNFGSIFLLDDDWHTAHRYNRNTTKERTEIYNVSDIIECLRTNIGNNLLSDQKLMRGEFKSLISEFITGLNVSQLRKLLHKDSINLCNRTSRVFISKYNGNDVRFCLNTKTPFSMPSSAKRISIDKLLDLKLITDEYMKDKKMINHIYNNTGLFDYMKMIFEKIVDNKSFENHQTGQEVLEEIGLKLCNVKPMKGFVLRLAKQEKNIFTQAANFYKI